MAAATATTPATGPIDVTGANGQPSSTVFQPSAAAQALLGPNASTANQLYGTAAPVTDINAAVNDLFGSAIQANELTGNAGVAAATDTSQAQAEQVTAAGDTQEAQAYLTAAGVANSNSTLALASGQIQQAQEARQIYQTVSGQQADIAASGFSGNSLDALYLAKASIQQGTLAQQLTGTQAQIVSGGFQQQAAAANAEATAATAAGAEASALAGGATDAASLVQQNAASQGAMLQTNALNNAMLLLDQYPSPYGSGGAGPAFVPGVSSPGGVVSGSTGAAGSGGANPWAPPGTYITANVTGTAGPSPWNNTANVLGSAVPNTRGQVQEGVNVNLSKISTDSAL